MQVLKNSIVEVSKHGPRKEFIDFIKQFINEEDISKDSILVDVETIASFSDDEKKALKLVRSTAYGIAKMFNCKSATKAHRNADKTLNSLQISFFKNE